MIEKVCMEIKIIKDSYEDILGKNRAKWNLAYKNNLFYFAVYAVVGSIILILNGFESKNVDDFWGIGSSMGLGLVFLSVFYFSHTYRNKRKYLEQTRALIAKSKSDGRKTELLLKDDHVTYKNFESLCEWKWSVFKSYMLYNDYLFLIMGGSVLNSITIQKNEVSVDEFAELINFCKGHLHLKK
jgi:hypothetical protein